MKGEQITHLEVMVLYKRRGNYVFDIVHGKGLKEGILEEAHSFAYVMHPGSTKMYLTLKAYYWWSGMHR